MNVITLKGFDNTSNIVLNEAFVLANKYFCSEVNSAHLMCSALRCNPIMRLFKKDTGIEPSVFVKTYTEMMEKQNDVAGHIDDEGDGIELGIDDLSMELYNTVSNTIAYAKERNQYVNIVLLYKKIVTNKESYVWDVLKMMGVDIEKCIAALENPLDNMPITSQFSVDYNVLAREGRFDPIEARDDVIEATIEVLGRRIKNNPCLVGEAGVGKTAIVEGMAQKLLTGNVPPYLKGKHIISVDISGIVSGSKFRGTLKKD